MEVSFGELIVVFLVALLVLGPQELVLKAHTLGRWFAKMRTEFNNFKILTEEQIMKRAQSDVLAKPAPKIPEPVEKGDA